MHTAHMPLCCVMQGLPIRFEWPLSGFAFFNEDAERRNEVAVGSHNVAEIAIARLPPNCAMPQAAAEQPFEDMRTGLPLNVDALCEMGLGRSAAMSTARQVE